MASYANKNYGAANYQKFRPSYPESLFTALRSYAGTDPEMTVDLACGTGQATRSLATFSKKVFGVDNSEVMIGEAKQNPIENVDYIVGNDTTLTSQFKEHSVDLLTVAEAAHWLTYPDFWEAAHTVLKPNGTLAIFSYYLFKLVDYPEAEDIIADLNFNTDKLGGWWDPGQWRLRDMYQSLQLPTNLFKEEKRSVNTFDKPRPEEPFELVRDDATLGDVMDLLGTWSAYAKWKAANPDKPDLLETVHDKIVKVTGLKDDQKIRVKWQTVYIFARAI